MKKVTGGDIAKAHGIDDFKKTVFVSMHTTSKMTINDGDNKQSTRYGPSVGPSSAFLLLEYDEFHLQLLHEFLIVIASSC